MLAEIRRTIAHEGMFSRHEPLWVAVSGGIDSMVLLHVLRSLGHTCSVVHIDHRLRGAESDADRHLVEEHCRAHGILLIVERVDVQRHAELERLSTQMAARELRYAVFNRLLAGSGPHKMALAHHADDAVETLLMNLMRGAGIAGWASIPPVAGPFVRPLIAVDRVAIQRYAHEHGVAYREDSSNTDPHYLRNRVRHELLPLFHSLRPGSRRVVAREVDRLRDLVGVVDRSFRGSLASNTPRNDGSWLVPFAVIEASGAEALFLQWLLVGKGFHPEVVEDLLDAMRSSHTGARFFSHSHVITVERRDLHVASRGDQPWPEVLIADDLVVAPDGGIALERCHPIDIHLQDGPGTAWLDHGKLKFPLLLRAWQPGDRMRPIGLGGSKLISDMLTDAKVPTARRSHQRVLVSGGEIIWLVGHRVAEGYAADTGTTHVLKLTDPG
ncbi:MAG: tRNA lysidine(34) synthetase TilS [Flavobacteriales bacterium]